MSRMKLVSIATMLVLAMMLTACNGTPSQGEVNKPGSEQSELPSSSVKPSESENPIEVWVSLTEDEVKWFNEQFFNTDEDVRKNSFLTCTYTDVSKISIYDIFYDMSEEISDQEENALKGSEIDYETDFQKLTIAYMDGILRANMNITLEEVDKSDLSKYMYLKEFDAYFDSHGDANGSPVEVKSGVKDENGNVKLQYFCVEDEKEYIVTLKAHENGYYFVSNVLAE